MTLRVAVLLCVAALLCWFEGVSRGHWQSGPFNLNVTTVLVCAISAGSVVAALYGILLAVASLSARKHRPTKDLSDIRDDVDVLVASRDEGHHLIDCVESLLAQDHPGSITVWVLLGSDQDSSWPLLQARYSLHPLEDLLWAATPRDSRQIRILFCQKNSKPEKLNLALTMAKAPWLAVLDADHEAYPHWIRHSLIRLAIGDVAGVQSRRTPQELPGLIGTWDSWQTHVGNEMINASLDSWNRGVLYTGSGGVFARHVFTSHAFADSHAEDTWLSHDLWLDNKRVAWLESPSSQESLPPDLSSFLRRRRRWARAHTASTAAHVAGFMASPRGLVDKILALAHGYFHCAIGLWALTYVAWASYYFFQFPGSIRMGTLLTAATLSFIVALVQRPDNLGLFLRDLAAGTGLMLPPATLTTLLCFRWNCLEIAWEPLGFPRLPWLLGLHLTALVGCAIPLVMGWKRFGRRGGEALIVLFTWPLGAFLAAAGTWYGLSDLVFATPTWQRISRNPGSAPWKLLLDLMSSSRRGMRFLRTVVILGLVLGCIAANDAIIRHSGGRLLGLTVEPLLFGSRQDVMVEMRRVWRDKHVELEIDLTLNPSVESPVAVEHTLDGMVVGQHELTPQRPQATTRASLSPPWSQHMLSTRIGEQLSQRMIAASAIRLRDNRLEINGEPFLIKGIVPVFPRQSPGLTPDILFARFRDMGVNVLRLYHEASPDWIAAARRHGLLILEQPNGSTWNEMDPDSRWSLGRLMARYEGLVEAQMGEPAALVANFGNEIELGGESGAAGSLEQAFRALASRRRGQLTSYATFKLDHRYSLPLIGINTPETGSLYWERALPLYRREWGAFYGSEFGGFLSDTEVTPTSVRLGRIVDQWRILGALNAAGGVFFYSHDNWAQPRFNGWNDPFSPDFPDDLRGLWDHLDQPKAELGVMQDLFSDLLVTRLSAPAARPVIVTLSNRRDWALRDLTLFHLGSSLATLKTLPAGASRTLELSLPDSAAGLVPLTARYFTHQGLPSGSTIRIGLAAPGGSAEILTPQVMPWLGGQGLQLWQGTLVHVATNGHDVTLNGIRLTPDDQGIALCTLPEGPDLEVESVEVSRNLSAPLPWDGDDPGEGLISMSFLLPKAVSSRPECHLVLDGLASPDWKLIHATRQHVFEGSLGPSRRYGEILVDLSTVPGPERRGPWTLTLHRSTQRMAYGVSILLKTPRVVSPVPLELKVDEGKTTPASPGP
ncbi:MAG: glycosyltransferase family 2 protein [Planctomycetota bacterium]